MLPFFLKSLNAQLLLILTFITPILEYHAYNTYQGTEEKKGDSLTHYHTMKKNGLILSSHLTQPPIQYFHWLMLNLGILNGDLEKYL